MRKRKSQTESLSGLKEYSYTETTEEDSHNYLVPKILKIMTELSISQINQKRFFDLGCGNGYLLNEAFKLGWSGTGVDVSVSGINMGRLKFPEIDIHEGSAYDDLTATYGQFPLVTSCEVVEHLYAPRDFARTIFNLLEPTGFAIITTPYHGYWKNLAIALLDGMDAHFTALWDHGHIKFFSKKTLSSLLTEAGFEICEFHYAGRFPPFQKSMIVLCKKP